MSNLSGTIKTIQNIMRKDAGVDGDAQRISQLVWMLFLKIFDDKEKDYEILEDNYQSPIPEPLRWSNWAADEEGITGEAMLRFINNELFPTLKELPVRGPKDHAQIIRLVFEDSYNYMKSGTLIRQVVNEINKGIDLTTTEERHLFNDIYEQILRDLQSAGNAGEYYTPRAATQFVVEMVNHTWVKQCLIRLVVQLDFWSIPLNISVLLMVSRAWKIAKCCKIVLKE
ncbi:type I restriction-modification system subunit M N-terminal domain-containing protein [Cytophagaceae bacterium BD1B2-1]|uniref:site-specific DNA-methyltransferase (adenine-specific) n=1 Tax=Xanthocytophaga agilis TaxID=3048010 RepID=A0AAE3RC56_9BACT|nr:type I restriction-modification system subunit M N-terminal domain-containing protein [Xanthocytophaga agilis]MDJ1505584.1 type I restriction-modification system subunit M N-terminal domain-containing protein [Xanthocytophaga agilis]